MTYIEKDLKKSGYRCIRGASQVSLVVKNLPANAGDQRGLDLILGLGRSPGEEHGNPLQCSCLENPTDRGAWRAAVHRVRHESAGLPVDGQATVMESQRAGHDLESKQHHIIDNPLLHGSHLLVQKR